MSPHTESELVKCVVSRHSVTGFNNLPTSCLSYTIQTRRSWGVFFKLFIYEIVYETIWERRNHVAADETCCETLQVGSNGLGFRRVKDVNTHRSANTGPAIPPKPDRRIPRHGCEEVVFNSRKKHCRFLNFPRRTSELSPKTAVSLRVAPPLNPP